MRICITGAAGFIGSNLIPFLLDQGNEIIGIDNFFLGKKEHLSVYADKTPFKFYEHDLLDLDGLNKIFSENAIDLVWHLCANSDISYGAKYTDFDLKGGTIATYNVLESIRLNHIDKIIFSSSGAVYGEPHQYPTPEDYGPLFPVSLYGASKVACETLISSFSHTFDVQAWIYRFGNIIGKNPTHGALFDFVKKLNNNPDELVVFGDGSQTKPYIHVGECIDGMWYGFNNSKNALNYFNIAVDSFTSVKFMAEETIKAMGLNAKINYTGGKVGWRGDVNKVRMDHRKLKNLGWEPKLSSDEAVLKSINEIVGQYGKYN